MSTPTPQTGAKVIARCLQDLGVTVIFALVGIPIVDIAESAIDIGIRVITFRNEQSCSYAASVYGYLTGRPGVCLLTGGPGVIHGLAGIFNSSENAFPTLFLGGSSETSTNTRGGFQELDHIALLTPHTKRAIRPTSNDPAAIFNAIHTGYRTCWYGRPGPSFIDLPADIIMSPSPLTASSQPALPPPTVPPPPKPAPDSSLISAAATLLRSARSPLVILGKGTAYSWAEHPIRQLITTTHLPFLPTPMGKGIMPDSSPLNTSSARSTALHGADVILLLGARLNWILSFGMPPKFDPRVKFIQVDVSPEDLGRTNGQGEASLGIYADIGLTVVALTEALRGHTFLPTPSLEQSSSGSRYARLLVEAIRRNEAKASRLALTPTPTASTTPTPLSFHRAFHLISSTISHLSPPSSGSTVYISEGSQTMDISRAIFPLEFPRQKLDAGTAGTMGVGLGYAIAAYAAYNFDHAYPRVLQDPLCELAGKGEKKRKKIVCLEGDSALGFSGMEIETMARYRMPILVIVMNNSGIYHGDTADPERWRELQGVTVAKQRRDGWVDPNGESNVQEAKGGGNWKGKGGLRSTSLLHETRYDLLATMVGGLGFLVRTEAELIHAVDIGYREEERVVVINVIIEPGNTKSMVEHYEEAKRRSGGAGAAKL